MYTWPQSAVVVSLTGVPLLAFGRSRGYFTSGGTGLFLSFFAALDVAPARGLTVGSLAQGQRLVLTMDDLSQSLKEYGITVKKVCAQGPPF